MKENFLNESAQAFCQRFHKAGLRVFSETGIIVRVSHLIISHPVDEEKNICRSVHVCERFR